MQCRTPPPRHPSLAGDLFNLAKGNHPIHFLFGLYLPLIAACSLALSLGAPQWVILAQFGWPILGGCLILLLGIDPKDVRLSTFFKGLFVYGTLLVWPFWIYHFRHRITFKLK